MLEHSRTASDIMQDIYHMLCSVPNLVDHGHFHKDVGRQVNYFTSRPQKFIGEKCDKVLFMRALVVSDSYDCVLVLFITKVHM